jgi:hypothetical protein
MLSEPVKAVLSVRKLVYADESNPTSQQKFGRVCVEE